MTRKIGKEEILNRFLETASKKWDVKEVEKIRTTLERTAEASWKVENFQLKPKEEPTFSITFLHQRNWRRTTEQEGSR